MVRLEKVLYEQAVNGMSRARAISAPKKWYYANPYEHLRRIPSSIQSTTITSRSTPFSVRSSHPSPSGSPFSKCDSNLTSSASKDSYLSHNQTPEDRLLHMDKHLRRNVLFEHIARETYLTAHPASIPIIGSSRSEEEKDGLRSTSVSQDSSSLSTSRMRHKLKPTSIIWNCKVSGPTISTTTTILIWLLKPEDQLYLKSTLSSYSRTSGPSETKPGIDTSWTRRTKFGSPVRRPEKWETRRPSPSTLPLLKAKKTSKSTSTTSMRRYLELSALLELSSTSRPITRSWACDQLAYNHTISINFN